MTMTRVESSNIDAVGYFEKERVLLVRFKSGNIYKYFEVPQKIYLELINAESKGIYFNRFVKNAFAYEHVS